METLQIDIDKSETDWTYPETFGAFKLRKSKAEEGDPRTILPGKNIEVESVANLFSALIESASKSNSQFGLLPFG